eukprot:NODE_14647_length_1095_cov_7.121901.p1 GENE.NODE_14647_length_1095_cov_7.121901~~NODE_14647_length_1095_cov_7.121901.p1  ORF type:complete len:251 (-),score=80.11 NODE_14647_length_1095_cov_7.121901:284-1036(-)
MAGPSAQLYARSWATAQHGRRAAGVPLRIAQFNILADGLSGKDVNGGGFTATPCAALEWMHRRQRLVEELTRFGLPSVIALQEVDHFHDWFRGVLGELGYSGSFAPKPNSPCKMLQLLERVHSKGLPCIIAGDLNATPVQGKLDYPSVVYPTTLQHALGLQSVYALALGSEPPYTTWKRRGEREEKHTIDYIFVSPDFGVERVLLMPADEDVDATRLPGWRYPSDHFALMADLTVPLCGHGQAPHGKSDM